jgi:hypothetical protein
MMSFDEFIAATTRPAIISGESLRLATAAYLARYKGDSRMHTESDLRIYLAWCAERGLEPLAVRRAHVEVYMRWLQEVRRFRPSTVSAAPVGGGRFLPDPCQRGSSQMAARSPAAGQRCQLAITGRFGINRSVYEGS